jgi:flagellar biosynthesis protein FlhG
VKPLSEQDHYEALDVPQSATRDEIERAYHLAKATYADDSLAGYSVFQEGDAPALRERLEIAYRTLADAEARRAYDAELASPVQRARSEPEPQLASAAPAAPAPAAAVAIAETRLPPPTSLASDLEEDESESDEEAEYDGPRLERLRARRGIELDEIAGVTKVNPTYLRFIEEERFDDLPAAVYVRGFVKCYARCLGLDPDRVARSYMSRYEERSSKRRRGLFSRRG